MQPYQRSNELTTSFSPSLSKAMASAEPSPAAGEAAPSGFAQASCSVMDGDILEPFWSSVGGVVSFLLSVALSSDDGFVVSGVMALSSVILIALLLVLTRDV
jgi:hypothetical protein